MKIFNILAVTAAASMLVGCAEKKTEENSATIVQTGFVQSDSAFSVQEFPGRVVASSEVSVSFKVPGTLKRVFVNEGDYVAEGTVLAELDDRDIRNLYDATEAEYKKTVADCQRVMRLYEDSVATAAQYDQARYGLIQITAKYRNAQDQLSYCKIKAPVSGRVQTKWYNGGVTVMAGLPVVTIVSDNVPEIQIEISGAEYIRQREFRAFSASFDYAPDKVLPLRLLGISPKANANQLYTVRLGIVGRPDPMPVPGMTTLVKLSYKESGLTKFTVPNTALFEQDGESCVWVCKEDSTIEKRTVILEHLSSNGVATISGGVLEGDQIVTAGVSKLHEGEKVAPLEKVSTSNVGGLL